MSRICENCGKGKQVGMNVSHSHRRTKTAFEPNLQKIKVMKDGAMRSFRYCANCIKTISKAPQSPRTKKPVPAK